MRGIFSPLLQYYILTRRTLITLIPRLHMKHQHKKNIYTPRYILCGLRAVREIVRFVNDMYEH